MRIVRFERPGTQLGSVPVWGRLDGETVVQLHGLGGAPTGDWWPLAQVRLVQPVEPTKIVCCGRNYPQHAKEMGGEAPTEPRLFLKPPSALIGPGQSIVRPRGAGRIDPEGELGVVIGTTLRKATPDEAMAGVLGYTIVNDVTARELQTRDVIFGRAKGFDTFCPVGPWVETTLDPSDLQVQTEVDGVVRAQGRTSEMTFPVGALLSFISGVMTLCPGDLIATGTPPGVAPILAGNVVRISIQGIGTLENPVVDDLI